MPILAGETSRVHELAEGMRMGAFDIARGDVHLKEGITGLRKAVGMADLLGFDLEVHGIDQPLLEAANLHVVAVDDERPLVRRRSTRSTAAG